MTTLADKLLQKSGKTRADVASNSKVGRAFRRTGVQASAEFERVKYLPRMAWDERPDLEELRLALTEIYALPPMVCDAKCVCGGAGSMELFPVQAAALAAGFEAAGLYAPIVVGGGKTLVSFLISAVCEAERPLVLVPAKLRDKTKREFFRLRKHWNLPSTTIESYERLSVVKNAGMLDDLRPDIIVCDEAHRLKNTRAACTRRVARYLKKNPTRMAIMSGSLTTKSLREYWHLLRWALGAEGMPMPNQWDEMMVWADAVDAKSDSIARTSPGVLAELCTEPEEAALLKMGGDAELAAVRSGFRRRLTDTPGVVSTKQNQLGCTLTIRGVDVPTLHTDDVLDAHFDQLRGMWQTPDGWDFTEASDMWRHARELIAGFYMVWDPRPPDEWMDKRRNWKRFVRSVLKHSHVLDSELQVAQAADRGDLDTIADIEDRDENGIIRERIGDVRAEWLEIRDTFKVNAVPVWVHDHVVDYAVSWALEAPGIVWTEHPYIGRRIAEKAGIPYFGRGGLDSSGTAIEETDATRCVASVLANSEGRNLQYQWHRNLVVSCLPNAGSIEQLLGRTHRKGQKAEEVTVEFVLACREQLLGFHKALREAQYIKQTTGQPQKLLYADVDVVSEQDIVAMNGARW